MGRKIPAKKHHGVKDPAKQQEQRLAKIKTKINEAPANIDDQEVPKKVRMLFTKKAKRNKPPLSSLPKPEKKDLKDDKHKEFAPQRPLKKIPRLERMPGESDKDLLWRAELTTRKYLIQNKFEEKYDVDLETNYETGEVKIKKKDMSFLDSQKVKMEEPTNRWEKKKAKKMARLEEEKKERLLRRKEKLKQWKLKKKNKGVKEDDFSHIKPDKVEFGDVVQQPPQLTSKPRKSIVMARPGTRNLLLKTMIPNEKSTNLSGKRKDLSALDRQTLEAERIRVVELYRDMQKLKQSNNA